FKVYKAIREQRPDKRITLAGDSAGAGLCVSLTMRLKEMGEKLPDCLILHSPVIDLSGEIDRSINDDINDDFIIKKGTRESVDRLYVGDADPKNVEISPYFGDYHGFPPTFITCELHESLYADSVWLDSELEDAGVPVRTIEMDGAFHTYGTLGFLTIETARINRDIIKLIKNPEEPFGN
ncbi:MAG: alpha/beta hydrolase fold domain-containing protein, partial [Clostridia bacterium]|nr:alpha/beta hydrolase fold domain-containing protein [Clostridia bacterium]